MLSPTQGKYFQSAMPARPVTAKKRKPSVNKTAVRSSYMQPTFSRVMTMAVSGQVVAKVGRDDRGKAAIVNSQKVDAPEWRGAASTRMWCMHTASPTPFACGASGAGKRLVAGGMWWVGRNGHAAGLEDGRRWGATRCE